MQPSGPAPTASVAKPVEAEKCCVTRQL
jgi:hypothetical protein